MKQTVQVLLTVVISLAASASMAATDGKTLFLTCAGCHGDNGVSVSPEWPNLAGQKKDYLMKQIKDFKAGARKNALMEPMAQTLSEEDIVAVANYISELK